MYRSQVTEFASCCHRTQASESTTTRTTFTTTSSTYEGKGRHEGVACFETATTTKDDRQHTQLLVVGERGMTQCAVPLPRQLVLVCLAAAVRALVVSMVHDGAAGKDTAREVGVAGGAGGPPVSHSGAALAVGAGDGACGRVNRRVGGKDGQRQLRVLLQCSKPEHTHTK